MGESEKDKKLGQSVDGDGGEVVGAVDGSQQQDLSPAADSELTEKEDLDEVFDETGVSDETGALDETGTDSALVNNAGADQRADDESPSSSSSAPTSATPRENKPRRSWLGLFNLLLIIALVVVAYLYWQQEQVDRKLISERINSIEDALSSKLSRVDLSSLLEADQNANAERQGLQSSVGELESGQQALRQASEKLYELYGRDRNDWQLAEVEYLMRVAQHKLILQHDFEGAAMTLRVASEKIAEAADPGLLSVRVKISEEIAELKTRKRVDLVGITLALTELERRLMSLQPGFAVSVAEAAPEDAGTVEKSLLESSPTEVLDRLSRFVDSLVRVRYERTAPSATEATAIDVADSLRDWLKLARWAVLDRNESQYVQLLERAAQLFSGFYSQDKDENRDFLAELINLKSLGLTADKPDISGSLFLMRKILQQRAELSADNGVAQ